MSDYLEANRRKNYVKLVNKIVPDDLLPKLYAGGAITERDKDRIEKKNQNDSVQKGNEVLLEIVEKKSKLPILVQALTETGQTNMALLLDPNVREDGGDSSSQQPPPSSHQQQNQGQVQTNVPIVINVNNFPACPVEQNNELDSEPEILYSMASTSGGDSIQETNCLNNIESSGMKSISENGNYGHKSVGENGDSLRLSLSSSPNESVGKYESKPTIDASPTGPSTTSGARRLDEKSDIEEQTLSKQLDNKDATQLNLIMSGTESEDNINANIEGIPGLSEVLDNIPEVSNVPTDVLDENLPNVLDNHRSQIGSNETDGLESQDNSATESKSDNSINVGDESGSTEIAVCQEDLETDGEPEVVEKESMNAETRPENNVSNNSSNVVPSVTPNVEPMGPEKEKLSSEIKREDEDNANSNSVLQSGTPDDEPIWPEKEDLVSEINKSEDEGDVESDKLDIAQGSSVIQPGDNFTETISSEDVSSPPTSTTTEGNVPTCASQGVRKRYTKQAEGEGMNHPERGVNDHPMQQHQDIETQSDIGFKTVAVAVFGIGAIAGFMFYKWSQN